MNTKTYQGWTKKFTISEIDYYLQIGIVGPDDMEDFPHMSIGDICYLDLTTSKQQEELRVYEVLMMMARQLLKSGGTVRDVIEVLIYQSFAPCGVTTDVDIPMCQSPCDFIGRYLLRKTDKV